MPHSPRWYAGWLWVCESGAGTLGFIDPNSLKYMPIAEVPGFTRGLDFAGNLAFVGLSQVRESAVFSGIAITERLAEEQRRLRDRPDHRAGGGDIAVRDRRTGVLRRDGASGTQVSGTDQRRRETAGELVRGVRRGAGRCVAGAAGSCRTEPWRGGVGRERETAARAFVKTSGILFINQVSFKTRERRNHVSQLSHGSGEGRAGNGRVPETAAVADATDGGGPGGPPSAVHVHRDQQRQQRRRLAALRDRPGEYSRGGEHNRIRFVFQHAADDHPGWHPARAERQRTDR